MHWSYLIYIVGNGYEVDICLIFGVNVLGVHITDCDMVAGWIDKLVVVEEVETTVEVKSVFGCEGGAKCVEGLEF